MSAILEKLFVGKKRNLSEACYNGAATLLFNHFEEKQNMKKEMSRTLLVVAGLGVALAPQMAHAKMRTLTVRSKTLAQTTWINPSTRLVLENTVKLSGKRPLVLNGGVLVVKKRLVVPSGQKVFVYDGELDGNGEIEVRPGGELYFSGNKSKKLDDITLNNWGKVTWGGKGRIDCSESAVVKNYGTLYLGNGAHKNHKGKAQFINHGFIIDISGGEGFTLDGSLTNHGTFEMNAAPTSAKARRKWLKWHKERDDNNDKTSLPTPTLIVGIGTIGTPGSTLQTTIRSDYYGQLYIGGTFNVTGGTLKYVLGTPGFPAVGSSDVFNVINAGTIGGTPGDFSAFLPSPFQFDRQKITVGGRRMYQLYDFD